VPLTRGLLRTHTSICPLSGKDRRGTQDQHPRDRPFIVQLQAMKRVANSGEPELAIVEAPSVGFDGTPNRLSNLPETVQDLPSTRTALRWRP